MILNKPTTKPIKAKIAITAMALSNELLGFWFSISLQIAEKNKHAPLGQMKNPKNTKNVIKSKNSTAFPAIFTHIRKALGFLKHWGGGQRGREC